MYAIIIPTFHSNFANSEPGSKVIKSTTTYTTNSSTGRAPVSRELVFDSPDSSSVNRSIRQLSPAYDTKIIESSSNVRRNVTYNDDGLYGKPRSIPSPLPVSKNYVTETRTQTISPSPRNDRQVVPLNEIVQVKNSDSSVLNDVPLPHEYLPKPGTKVTTTVRTYTYEIPESDGRIQFPEKNTAVLYKTDRRERSGGFYPATSTPAHPPVGNHPLAIQETPYNATSTSVYKYESNNSNSRKSTSTSGQQVPPGGITIYPPQNTIIHKSETINSANKQYHAGYPYHHRNEPSVVYKQTTTTRNVIHPPHETEPLIHPFPVERPNNNSEIDGNPPKRVEDLMATFGDVSKVEKFQFFRDFFYSH